MRIVVTGLIAQYSFGGVIWDYIQYVLGFRALGHEVWYLEDTGNWSYDQVGRTYSEDCSQNVQSLKTLMAQFGMQDHWIYRNAANGKFYGLGETEARAVLKSCDLVANVSGAAILDDYGLGSAHLMYLDGDPMFTQISMMNPGRPDIATRVKRHHSHFSFGLNIGQPDCLVPVAGVAWKQTVQPIVLDLWPFAEVPPRYDYTTVMNWASYSALSWQGRLYGQKDLEFMNYGELPQRCQRSFALAMGKGLGNHRPTEQLQKLGWQILEPESVAQDHVSYRQFISESHAEWSIAKHGYVQSNTGWFSCRTACYLAAGRPAVVQETGWSRTIPSGKGLLAFSSFDECVEQIRRLELDYDLHRESARRLAEDYFSADQVCDRLLADSGLA